MPLVFDPVVFDSVVFDTGGDSSATLAAMMDEIQYHLVEIVNQGESYSSEQWTKDEVLSYFRNRQNQFLKDTALLLKRATIAYTAGTLRQPLPDDWMITQRVVWADNNGTFKELPRSDFWDADYGNSAWVNTSTQKPEFYTDEELPSLQLAVGPIPTNTGSPQILYVYQDPLGLSTFNSSMRIDEFAPYPRVAGMPIQDRYRWTSVGLSIPLGSPVLTVPAQPIMQMGCSPRARSAAIVFLRVEILML